MAPTSRCVLITSARQAWIAHLRGRAARTRFLQQHVEVVNDGSEPVPVTGLELTDCCGQQHEHVYAFPQGELAAGQTAYVYSGKGKSHRRPTGDLILYAGLQAPVWKDDSHVAYLRHPYGRIVDTMHAGRPPRHPDGH